jgi:hypothetical protein
MSSSVIHWWGFRLRNPAEFDSSPLQRWEILWFGALLASVLEAIWLGCLLSCQLFKPSWENNLIPVVLFLAPMVLFLVFPKELFSKLPFSVWILLAREKGGIRWWDAWVILVAILGAVGTYLHMEGGQLWTGMCLFLSVMLCGVLQLLFLPGVDFGRRKWEVAFPDWLKEFSEDGRGGDGESDTTGIDPNEVSPDVGASPVFNLEVEDKRYPVGIRIPESVVDELRRLNGEAKGRLYQENPDAVVLLDHEPVSGLGKDEIIRLCRQFMCAASKHELTRLQIANLVLYFVQRNFNYKFDIDSTASIPGGPYEEYGRFALETLKDQVGDCECVSICAATILAYLGFETALLIMKINDPETEEMTGHCAVGLKASGAFFVSEDVPEGIDCFYDDNRQAYLFGEATSKEKQAFGGIPSCWKDSIPKESQIVVPLSL